MPVKMILRMFSRRWLLTSILVVLGVAVLARLGIWQLDRLAQRKAFNARVQSQLDQTELDLTDGNINLNLAGMEYRAVHVIGKYDHSQQITLRNQYWQNQWGVHLVTPLHIQNSDQIVLVDRGWIPADDFESGDWSKYDEPGLVEVRGMIRASQSKADFGMRRDATPLPGEGPLLAWNFVNIDLLKNQIEGSLLPIYIQEGPDPVWTDLPYRSLPELELTEGPHMGYAIQWFTFATILGLGYPFFIRRQEAKGVEEKQKMKVAEKPAQPQASHPG
jgi:surfeit locus 1 family protein